MTGQQYAAVRRLQLAFDLFLDGEALMAQNLRRRFPDATPEEIDKALLSWIRTRPGAEHGDCPGRVISFGR